MQGGKLAVVDTKNLITIVLMHSRAEDLLAEAANAYVQRECGSASGIVRAVQAATSPTEGQRMLQEGYSGAIVGGGSREKTSESTDGSGNVSVQRLAERSVCMDNGTEIHVQQVQQFATVQPEMVTMTNFHHVVTGLAGVFHQVADIVKKQDNTIDIITTSIKTHHLYVDKRLEELEEMMQAKDDVLQQKIDAKDKDLQQKTGAKDKLLEVKARQFEERLAFLEGANSNQRLRRLAHSGKSKTVQKNISFANGTFSWRKCLKKKRHYKGNYKSIAEAKEGLEQFCDKMQE